MLFKGSILEDVTLSFQRIGSGEAEITGRLASMKPELALNTNPIVTILMGHTRVSLECRKQTHYLKNITSKTGGISITQDFDTQFDVQDRAWKALAKTFSYLMCQGGVSTEGNIDWVEISKLKPKGQIEMGISKSSSINSSVLNRSSSVTVKKKILVPMYIRRCGKKPTDKNLSTLREKIKSIADKTFEPNIPTIAVKINLKDEEKALDQIGITVDDVDNMWEDCGMP